MITAPRISLARLPTALEPLDRLSEAVGGPRIWIKRDDTTDTPGCGNKLRKLEFSVGQALADGADTLITCGGSQSNHCRATAMVAAKLGLKCRLLLRGRPGNDGNQLLDSLFNADMNYVDGTGWQQLDEHLGRLADEVRNLGGTPFVIPTGASDEIGMWGYIAASEELSADFAAAGINPGALISATGSGGTLAGLVVGREMFGLKPEVIAFNVCDDEAWFVNKISTDIALWENRYDAAAGDTRINVIDGYVGPGYGRADKPVYDTIRRVAATEGVILDPVYSGKAFNAMLTELAQGRFDGMNDIVFLHTGGIFGIYPHRDLLSADAGP